MHVYIIQHGIVEVLQNWIWLLVLQYVCVYRKTSKSTLKQQCAVAVTITLN